MELEDDREVLGNSVQRHRCPCLFPPQYHALYHLSKWFWRTFSLSSQHDSLVLPGLLMYEQAGDRVRQRETRVALKIAGPPFCKNAEIACQEWRWRGRKQCCMSLTTPPQIPMPPATPDQCKSLHARDGSKLLQVVCVAQIDTHPFALEKPKEKQMALSEAIFYH